MWSECIPTIRGALSHLCMWEEGRSEAFKCLIRSLLWKLYWALKFLRYNSHGSPFLAGIMM